MARPSIYEFAGGEPAFRALATAHHQRCLDDPVLSHPFEHPGHPDHVQRLATYWAEVFGGPPKFTQECGSQSSVLYLHSGTGADNDLGERFVRAFNAAAQDAALPADPEFRAALSAYMEWAVAEVMSISPEGSVPPEGQPMPHWSWDGLVR